ncbi:MAG: C_GCAxxG_C_C family protein [Methanomicrobiaceae archaeon]|nr:C_GCAxxG_C_C family protein [Methanomicrobiaceae archaeon]
MKKADKAEELFKSGLNCAQSVILAFAGDLGVDAETSKRIARGFGSGMATGDTCGAVSGGIMAISLFVIDEGDAGAAKKKTYELAREFKKRFSEEAGSLMCRNILGYDVNDPESMKSIPADKLPRVVCGRYVNIAAGILEDMLM